MELSNYKLPGKKAMIVISNGNSMRKNGYVDTLIAQLIKKNISSAIFDEVMTNPTKVVAERGVEFAKSHDCDFIVALGGGSVMDISKVIATMCTNSGDVWDYISGGSGKGLPIGVKPLPLVCITTSAGTGSEVDPWGVVSNETVKEKIGFGGIIDLFPVLSIVDPMLMKTVPSKLTAYQGFDALFHATECYISKYANMMSDMFALEAMKNIAEYLPRAVKNGNDIVAREHVAFANTISGMVMNISVTTAKHSLEHAISAYHPRVEHGAGLIMIAKAFYRFFIDQHICDERFIKMAKALGKNDAMQASDFLIVLGELMELCQVDQLEMREYGIDKNELSAIAANARETMGGLFDANPCEMSHADCVKVLSDSYLKV